MLSRVVADGLTVRGISVGGIYTSLCVPELDVLLDMGIAPRSFVGCRNLLISHGHADHVGAVASHIGVCGLARLPAPRIFLPEELLGDLSEALGALGRGQRRPLEIAYEPLSPGAERLVAGNLWLRAVRTLHSIPSLGYLLFRRVPKLRPEFLELQPQEIRARRTAGEDLFTTEERGELGYVTDSLIDVLDQHPELYRAKVLVLESTFLDERKSRVEARAKLHVHFDEIIERASKFHCRALVLMHFSQKYAPREVHEIITRRCPDVLRDKIRILAPEKGSWPG